MLKSDAIGKDLAFTMVVLLEGSAAPCALAAASRAESNLAFTLEVRRSSGSARVPPQTFPLTYQLYIVCQCLPVPQTFRSNPHIGNEQQPLGV